MPNKIREIEEMDGFDMIVEESKNDVLVVIDFHAEWCGPCKQIKPQFSKMAEEFSNVKFAKIDVDEFEQLAEELDIPCMPTFVLYKNKKMVDKVIGANVQKLRQAIEKNK